MGTTTPAELAEHSKKSLPSPIPVPKSTLIENPVHLRQPRALQKATPAQSRLAQSGNPSPNSSRAPDSAPATQDAEPAFPTYFPHPA